MMRFSVDANYADMDRLEADTKLVNDLCAWAKVKPSRMAAELGMAATTLTRAANGKADTEMSRRTVDKLKAAYPDFPGWGDQPLPETNAQVVKMEGASLDEARDDLPIYGTALGAARDVEGDAIEQTYLNSGDTIEYVKRPVLLNRIHDAYGLYVQGSSMHPALPDGEMLAVTTKGALSMGDNVVVYLRPINRDDDGQRARAVLVKELVKRTGAYIELRQYDPPKVFRIDATDVLQIHRVLTRREMMA